LLQLAGHFEESDLRLGQVLNNSNTVISGRAPTRMGNNGGSDAAVDVKLAAGFFVPSADVGRLHSGETEAVAEELERQLATVSVASQCQVNAELDGLIETLGA
jgi:hypothetical protein